MQYLKPKFTVAVTDRKVDAFGRMMRRSIEENSPEYRRLHGPNHKYLDSGMGGMCRGCGLNEQGHKLKFGKRM